MNRSPVSITKCNPLNLAEYPPNPKFGVLFTPHMLKAKYTASTTILNADILPFQKEPLSPASLVLHYGQSVFEGMKAFFQPESQSEAQKVALFRPDLHAKRFVLSSLKLAIPPISEELFMQCLLEFIRFEKKCVPTLPQHSLYIRPLIIASDEAVKVSPSVNYNFYILTCVVGSYFPQGNVVPAKVLVQRNFVRAFPNGIGEAKTSANYAASLYSQTVAQSLGCDQVLYLSGVNHDDVDELGGMNFFMIRGNELVTPSLNGAILNGVTRRSILELAPFLGLKGREEPISFSEMIKDIEKGNILEVFACGTAAAVQPIGKIFFRENDKDKGRWISLPSDYSISKKLLFILGTVQRGTWKEASNEGSLGTALGPIREYTHNWLRYLEN